MRRSLRSLRSRPSGVGWMGHARALALLGLLALTLPAGCGRDGKDRPVSRDLAPVPAAGGVLRILHEHAMELDPRVVDDIYESTVVNQVYEGLVRYDPNLGIAPSLAESWIVAEDGLSYTFHLREGLSFHDGSSLDAAGVVASLERVLAPDRQGECIAETYLLQIVGARDYREGRAPHISGLRAPDPLTVSIELEEAVSFFLSVLAMDQTRIVPVGVPIGGTHRPIGTGPFEFVQRRTEEDREEIVLARHDGYWGEPGLLDSLIFVCALDGTANDEEKIELLVSGAVDGISLGTEYTSRVSGLGYRVTAAPELTISFLGFQTGTAPLDDVRVRQAIAHCLDHERFADVESAETLPATGILPPGIPGYLPSSRILSFDLERAADLLRAAGYGPEHPTPKLTLYTSGEGRSYEFFKGPFRDSLLEVGVPIEVSVVPWAELDHRVLAGTAPLFLLGWLADVPDADGFLYALFHSQASNNLFGLSEEEVDRDLDDARHMMPGPERTARYRDIESRILELAPIVPLYHELTCYAWNPDVVGIELGPYGLPSVRFARVQRVSGRTGAPGLAEDSQ